MTRGCGTRKGGGLYICTGLVPAGLPLEAFIIDPPIPYNGESFRSPILFERDGTHHVLVWVGEGFYRYASDYVEEVRLFGASRRIPVNFPIDKFSPGSMMFLVHAGAIIENYREMPQVDQCPKRLDSHLRNEEYCFNHVYDLAANQSGIRKVGDTTYRVSTSKLMIDPVLRAGIFLRLPITHIDHVRDHGRVNPKVVNTKTQIPLNLVDF